jgi:hypothetical protein
LIAKQFNDGAFIEEMLCRLKAQEQADKQAENAEVRFKLLALVPAVSIVAWVQSATAELLRTALGAVAGILVALAGLRLTHALEIYDLRNDALYDDAISRGWKIEEEQGVDTGLFRRRRRAVDKTKSHDTAVRIVFRTVKWIIVHYGLQFALL